MEKRLVGGSLEEAARHAEGARKSREMRLEKPKGPEKEPNKLNGVPKMPEKGMSKSY